MHFLTLPLFFLLNVSLHAVEQIPFYDERKFDYELFWYILIPFLLLALILLISHIILRQYNKKLEKEVAAKIEELRQKDEIMVKQYRMAEMGEMISMIAHQWRQPLTAIGYTTMGIEVKLSSGKFNFDDKVDREKFLHYLKEKLQNINEYVQYLSTTTDDFRNFFNPNKDKDTVSLTTIIENALKIVEKPMSKKGIAITKDYTVNIKIPLYQNEVMQVLLNLLKNSEDNFITKDITNPKIHISTQKDKDNYIISVCDNGGGIEADIIDKIFDPYFSTKNEKNGSGLGLYMSRIIIEEHHNGLFTVKNGEHGACFQITFKM